MTIRYNIEPDREALAEVTALFEFLGGNTRNANRIAINRTGPKVRTRASQAIRSQVRLKAGYVNQRLKFTRASNFNLNAKISAPSRGLLLTRYSTDTLISGDKVSWIKPPPVPARGIRVKVKPTGPIKVVRGDPETDGKPFYMALDSGVLAIAGRRKTPGPRGGKIKVFFAPSLSQVWTDVKDDVLPEAGDILTSEMADAIRYLLRKQLPSE